MLALPVIASPAGAQEKNSQDRRSDRHDQRVGRHHGRRLGARGADGRRGRRRHRRRHEGRDPVRRSSAEAGCRGGRGAAVDRPEPGRRHRRHPEHIRRPRHQPDRARRQHRADAVEFGRPRADRRAMLAQHRALDAGCLGRRLGDPESADGRRQEQEPGTGSGPTSPSAQTPSGMPAKRSRSLAARSSGQSRIRSARPTSRLSSCRRRIQMPTSSASQASPTTSPIS